MIKKLVSWLLTLALLLGCVSLAAAEGVTGETEDVVIDGITYHKATDMTAEPIELTYFHFDQDETVKVIRQDGSVFCTKTFTKAAFNSCLDDDYRKTGILEGLVFDKVEGNQLFFAASVSHPQTDEYIPLVVTLSNFGEVSISRDDTIE